MVEKHLPWAPWPYFDDEAIEACRAVLKSGRVNYWTGSVHTLPDGAKVRGETGLFEYEFAKYHSSKYAMTLANGSLALELALKMFGIGIGDEVITTPRTFIASASSCVIQGAIPVFADIEIESQNISVESIAKCINEKTKAVIAVHLAGWACELDGIKKLLLEKEKEFGHRIYLIEDCAQCLGGEYKGQKLGSIGDAGCFSFCQDKIITTGGEGGILITNDDEAYRKAWSFKDHGKDFDKYNKILEHPLVDQNKIESSSFYTSIGTNWRMTEMQAAIGRIALKKLDDWNLAHRKKYAGILFEAFKNIRGLKVYEVPSHIEHAYYKFYAFLDLDLLREDWTRDRIISEIESQGVVCQYGSTWGICKEAAWDKVELPNGKNINLRQKSDFVNDKIVGESSLMFQVHPTLDVFHIKKTIKAVAGVMNRAVLREID